MKVPPSLKVMFRELVRSDCLPAVPEHGSLRRWAENGVLLLNAVLTVEAHKAGSHRSFGWQRFTSCLLDQLQHHAEKQGRRLVFMLWGGYAKKKGSVIDRSRHLVLTAPHPSPLSAHRGFFGCRHFSKANQWLEQKGKPPVDWSLSRRTP